MKTRLIIVTGKGGVGKTVISASMGYALSRRGMRTLIIEVGEEGIVSGFFGKGDSEYEEKEVSPGLWAMRVDPWKALREYGLMKLHFGALYKLVFGNQLMSGLVQAVPGLSELLILGKVGFEVENRGKKKPAWDCVILDLPATGHGQGILSIPGTVIATMKTGPMASDARKLLDMLTDKRRSSIVMVTLCEAMPVQETLQYTKELGNTLNRGPDLIVANRILPVEMNEYEQKIIRDMRRAARRKGLVHLEEVLSMALKLAHMQDEQSALQVLESSIKFPVHSVPMIPMEGLPRIKAVAGYVDDWAIRLME